MRRAGQNPTDIEVLDILNRIDDNTGYLDFKVINVPGKLNSMSSMQEFCYIMREVTKDMDDETSYKESFRVFSKDEEGCIPPDEIKF